MEDDWIGLFDAAQQSLVFVTPSLNATPGVEAALNRALQRGVAVTIVAFVHPKADPGGELTTEVNIQFVERSAGRLNRWECDAPDVAVHAKMLIFDGRLSVVTSTKLNRRGFLHDTENGLSVPARGSARRLAALGPVVTSGGLPP